MKPQRHGEVHCGHGGQALPDTENAVYVLVSVVTPVVNRSDQQRSCGVVPLSACREKVTYARGIQMGLSFPQVS